MNDAASSTNPAIDLASMTAGRRAIAGFLLQILRSVQLGLKMTVKLSLVSDTTQMLMHLEPAEGGDVQVLGGPRDIVEQVKMRTPNGRWTTGEVGAKVLPDLLRAVRPGTDQSFRFVTNNGAGLGPLVNYIASRNRAAPVRHRWGASRIPTAEFELRLANAACLSEVTSNMRHLLDSLEIEIVDPASIEEEIDCALTPLLRPGDHPADRRHQLLGQLMLLATEGAQLSPADLLGLVSPDAHRLLAHIQSLPSLISHHLEEDARLIGYDRSWQARRALPEPIAELVVLSGESGQGKTWTLAQLAFDQVGRGELAVVMRAPTRLDDVIAFINERIWQPAHPERVTIPVMARSIGQALDRGDGTWLTVYIDDVQDRTFAQRLARSRWHEHGVRIVVSAQPRITNAIRAIRTDAQVIEISNFRSADLRRFLALHDRAEALETMPDDVFELLLKPVHASIFVRLEKRASWAGVSEYELFSAYWRETSLLARDQSDHPSDGHALTALAGTLLSGTAHYPWRITEVRGAGIDDAAIMRLEQVGLLRRPAPDRMAFAADRMLNWAVAESLAQRILDDGLTPASAEALFATIEGLKTKTGEVVGTRLGYVYFDTLWLLVRDASPEFVADLIWEHVERLPQEARSEDQWTDGFGSVGAAIIPALELLAARAIDEERDWDIPRNVPFAFAAIAVADPEPVQRSIAEQIASGEARRIDLGLRTARLVAAPLALERIWPEHVARAAAYEMLVPGSDVNERSRAIHRQELSFDALRLAIGADPDWLDARLGSETAVSALNQLLWMLNDPRVINGERATDVWICRRERLSALMPSTSKAFIESIGHFRDTSLASVLDDAAADPEEGLADRVLRSRARLTPQAALQAIADGADAYGWSAANWWFDDLLAADPAGLANAIRTRAHRSDDHLTDTILYYRFNPDAMGAETLEEVLDTFAERLRAYNEAGPDPDEHEGPLHHPLSFLPTLPEPWQFDALRARAGTAIETELVRFASARRGRRSMTRDTTGNECERILAMIGGDGYDRLVLTELDRPNQFGRQDGFVSARWTASTAVGEALSTSAGESDTESYGAVVRMEALAVHARDAELEAMVRAGTSIYVSAAEMRSSGGRDVSKLRTRIAALLQSSDDASLDTAAALTGFLQGPEDALPLLPVFLDPATSVTIRRRILASCRALGFYAPEMLPIARSLIDGQSDEEAQFVVAYLAEAGDGEARRAATDWLKTQGLSGSSNFRQNLLPPLLRHEDSRPTVLAYLQSHRASGGLIADGGLLKLLAEAGDAKAQDELLRATHRYTGFARQNTIIAIGYLRQEEPEEAYFAAQRLLSRHQVASAADLMLEIDLERAAPELIERYRRAPPSLRLEIKRRLRVHLDGEAFATLIAPLAHSLRASDREIAADLAAAVPSGVPLFWLATLAGNPSPAVRGAAQSAIRQRRLEAAALLHRDLILSSPKMQQWARLSTIFDIVDPFYLWARYDPTSLEQVFDELDCEFLSAARQMRTKALKIREDEAKKQDKRR